MLRTCSLLKFYVSQRCIDVDASFFRAADTDMSMYVLKKRRRPQLAGVPAWWGFEGIGVYPWSSCLLQA